MYNIVFRKTHQSCEEVHQLYRENKLVRQVQDALKRIVSNSCTHAKCNYYFVGWEGGGEEVGRYLPEYRRQGAAVDIRTLWIERLRLGENDSKYSTLQIERAKLCAVIK